MPLVSHKTPHIALLIHFVDSLSCIFFVKNFASVCNCCLGGEQGRGAVRQLWAGAGLELELPAASADQPHQPGEGGRQNRQQLGAGASIRQSAAPASC